MNRSTERSIDPVGRPRRVRGDDDIRRVVERRFGAERLLAEDVEHRAADPARLERPPQGELVDEPAAGDVDEPGVLAHLGQLLRADEPRGVVGQRRGDDDDVAGPQHLAKVLEAEQLDALGAAVGMAARRQDAAPERQEQAGDLRADAPVADDPDRELGELPAAQRLPGPLALELEELRKPSGDGQRHHHDVLGDRLAEDAAGVRDVRPRSRTDGIEMRSTPAEAEWIHRSFGARDRT